MDTDLVAMSHVHVNAKSNRCGFFNAPKKVLLFTELTYKYFDY